MMHLFKTRALLFALTVPVVATLVATSLAQPQAAQAPITRVSFSRSPCYGFCPSYSVVIQRDGSATWKNALFVPRLGERRGRITPERFAALAALLDGPGLPSLLAQVKRNALKPRPTDTAGFSLSIERGDQKTEVEDFGFGTPAEFVSLEKQLDEAANSVAWGYEDTGIIEAPAVPRDAARIFFVHSAKSASAKSAPGGDQETGRILVAKGQRFEVTLPPGDYVVGWRDATGSHERPAKVVAGYFASIAL